MLLAVFDLLPSPSLPFGGLPAPHFAETGRLLAIALPPTPRSKPASATFAHTRTERPACRFPDGPTGADGLRWSSLLSSDGKPNPTRAARGTSEVPRAVSLALGRRTPRRSSRPSPLSLHPPCLVPRRSRTEEGRRRRSRPLRNLSVPEGNGTEGNGKDRSTSLTYLQAFPVPKSQAFSVSVPSDRRLPRAACATDRTRERKLPPADKTWRR